VFRGVVFARMVAIGLPGLGAALSTALFTLSHANQEDPMKLVVVALGSLAMCGAFYVSGSLWAPVLVHVANNTLLTTQFDRFRGNTDDAVVQPFKLARELAAPDNVVYNDVLVERRARLAAALQYQDWMGIPLRALYALVPSGLSSAKQARAVQPDELRGRVRGVLEAVGAPQLSESQFWALVGPDPDTRRLLESARAQLMTEVGMLSARSLINDARKGIEGVRACVYACVCGLWK
jgi:hypothetical protein